MFIKCKNCDAENPLGAVFCRSCGVKLDTENLDKDFENFLNKKNKKNNFNSIFRLIFILIILFILYLAYAIINPFGKSYNDGLIFSKEVKQQAISKYNSMKMGRQNIYSFTPEQLNFIFNKYFIKKGDHLFVDISDVNYLNFTIRKQLISDNITWLQSIKKYVNLNWKVSITAVCEPYFTETKSGKKVISLKLLKLKIGSLTVPSYIHKYILDEYKAFYSTRKFKRLAKSIKDIKVDKDQIKLLLYKRRR
ncbi:MAG TPA: zinc ribbon domain-containing protein [Victivallales bacterium]|nr:zinc ribbon domain-containing protein [Victivallales bacterium]